MELKQYNIEPTEENVLQSLLNNTMGRNSALRPFLEVIASPAVSSLALNGSWGSGKTFFIKQAILLLQSLEHAPTLEADTQAQLDSCLGGNRAGLSRPDLSGSYLPVYYNAWLYDDHEDPIRSLLYFLSVTFHKQYGIRSPSAMDILCGVMETLGKWKQLDLSALSNAFSSEDPVSAIQDLEEVKLCLQDAFHDLLGDGRTLVVFVDELDRCSPAYAVRLLERIKHFFDCPQVKFVFSTNLLQLSATIENYYGASFDSTKYLTKFFDFSVELPPVSLDNYLNRQGALSESNLYWDLCRCLIGFFHFSIRDLNSFLTAATQMSPRIHFITERGWNRSSDNVAALIFFPPVLAALRCHSRADYDRVISGSGGSIIKEIFERWPDGTALLSLLHNHTPFSKEEAATAILQLYDSAFKQNGSSADYNGALAHTILEIVSHLY